MFKISCSKFVWILTGSLAISFETTAVGFLALNIIIACCRKGSPTVFLVKYISYSNRLYIILKKLVKINNNNNKTVRLTCNASPGRTTLMHRKLLLDVGDIKARCPSWKNPYFFLVLASSICMDVWCRWNMHTCIYIYIYIYINIYIYIYIYTSWVARAFTTSQLPHPRPLLPRAPSTFTILTIPRPVSGCSRPTCKVSALYLKNCANALRQTQTESILFVDIDINTRVYMYIVSGLVVRVPDLWSDGCESKSWLLSVLDKLRQATHTEESLFTKRINWYHLGGGETNMWLDKLQVLCCRRLLACNAINKMLWYLVNAWSNSQWTGAIYGIERNINSWLSPMTSANVRSS